MGMHGKLESVNLSATYILKGLVDQNNPYYQNLLIRRGQSLCQEIPRPTMLLTN